MVYKSRRKDAAAEFIADARELRKVTNRTIKRFPKSYRWITTNKLLELAGSIYTNCVKANEIYVHKDMTEDDFKLRHRYLLIAQTDAAALLGEITFCYELVDDGNNFFKSREEYDRVFANWTSAGNAAHKRIKNLIESDARRYKGYQKAKADAAAKAAAAQSAEQRETEEIYIFAAAVAEAMVKAIAENRNKQKIS